VKRAHFGPNLTSFSSSAISSDGSEGRTCSVCTQVTSNSRRISQGCCTRSTRGSVSEVSYEILKELRAAGYEV
jgi:hypothetical protein